MQQNVVMEISLYLNLLNTQNYFSTCVKLRKLWNSDEYWRWREGRENLDRWRRISSYSSLPYCFESYITLKSIHGVTYGSNMHLSLHICIQRCINSQNLVLLNHFLSKTRRIKKSFVSKIPFLSPSYIDDKRIYNYMKNSTISCSSIEMLLKKDTSHCIYSKPKFSFYVAYTRREKLIKYINFIENLHDYLSGYLPLSQCKDEMIIMYCKGVLASGDEEIGRKILLRISRAPYSPYVYLSGNGTLIQLVQEIVSLDRKLMCSCLRTSIKRTSRAIIVSLLNNMNSSFELSLCLTERIIRYRRTDLLDLIDVSLIEKIMDKSILYGYFELRDYLSSKDRITFLFDWNEMKERESVLI